MRVGAAVTAGVVAAVFLMMLRGCLGDEATKEGSTHWDREGGVLSISSGSGGFIMEPPNKRVDTWWGTWGSFQLCVTEPGKAVTIKGYRLDAEIEPLESYVGVRIIDPKLYKNATWRQRSALATIGAAYGQPLRFKGGGEPRAAGTFHRGVEGIEVTATCDETLNFGPDSDQPLQELMAVMKAGPKGAMVRSMEVDYTVDGREMTLRTRWHMGMCGTEVKGLDPDTCTQ